MDSRIVFVAIGVFVAGLLLRGLLHAIEWLAQRAKKPRGVAAAQAAGELLEKAGVLAGTVAVCGFVAYSGYTALDDPEWRLAAISGWIAFGGLVVFGAMALISNDFMDRLPEWINTIRAVVAVIALAAFCGGFVVSCVAWPRPSGGGYDCEIDYDRQGQHCR